MLHFPSKPNLNSFKTCERHHVLALALAAFMAIWVGNNEFHIVVEYPEFLTCMDVALQVQVRKLFIVDHFLIGIEYNA